MQQHPILIFDYDGTIHETFRIYGPAFRNCYKWLVQEGCAEFEEISDERIKSWLGMNSHDMWNSFLPDLPEEIKALASAKVGASMVEQIENHKAVWYPKAKETLTLLKQEGYEMQILSNCKIAYANANRKEFHTEEWFSEYHACEAYHFRPKTEIIHEILKQESRTCIVIGDRESDYACAREIKAPFVACMYGYSSEGELKPEGEKYRAISQIHELPGALAELEKKM